MCHQTECIKTLPTLLTFEESLTFFFLTARGCSLIRRRPLKGFATARKKSLSDASHEFNFSKRSWRFQYALAVIHFIPFQYLLTLNYINGVLLPVESGVRKLYYCSYQSKHVRFCFEPLGEFIYLLWVAVSPLYRRFPYVSLCFPFPVLPVLPALLSINTCLPSAHHLSQSAHLPLISLSAHSVSAHALQPFCTTLW